ncbi:MAG TPA: hypothetical protein VG488_14035 [Candidatus Angelobacter sp.]|jgi:hypothetical protein|nr:hypothetical protein [Candidatus Angelobacter sp.]
MVNRNDAIRVLTMIALTLSSAALFAQTATGTINSTLVNKSGISLIFDTAPASVTLGNSGTSAASANFGIISAFGTLSAGVTRPSVGPTTFTVQTTFDVNVIEGGLTSANYTLTANLAAAAPTGISYKVDAVSLTTAAQTITTNGTYNADVAHNLGLVVSMSAPGSGGPAVGFPITATINFTATAN